LFIAVLILSSIFSMAQVDSGLESGDMETALSQFQGEFVGSTIPAPVKFFLSDEVIVFHVTLADGSGVDMNLVIENSKVVSFDDSAVTQATYEFFLSEEVIIMIAESQDPMQSLQQAVKDGGISYEASSFWKRIKMKSALALLGLAG